MKEYKILKVEEASNKKKKYKTTLKHRKTGKTKSFSWGARGYQQYRDRTKLKLYAHLDHNDNTRKERYMKRHIGFIRKGYYSPGQQSWFWLWT